MKKFNVMSICCALLGMLSSCIGLFYSFGGSRFTVFNLYGDEVELFGDGIYENDSIFKVGTSRGADLTALIICVLLIGIALWKKKKRSMYYVQAGLLVSILYISTCLLMGSVFNRMFLVYLVQFSLTFFTFFYLVNDLMRKEDLKKIQEKKLTGTAVFTMIAGCSVLIWLTAIVPAVINGKPMNNIAIYVTEPTFVLDLGIILPFCWISGINMLKRKVTGYKMAPIIFTLLCAVGVSVIFGTMLQKSLGITLSIGEIIGPVISFIVLAIISAGELVKMLRLMNECE